MSQMPLVCALVATVACAPGLPPTATATFDDDDVILAGSGPGAPADEAPAEDGAERETQPAVTEAAIDGRELDSVLDAGPGVFLAAVEVRPVFRGKAFRGWELVDIRTPRLAASPLRRGDLITSVNDRSLKRPEDLHTVWDELRAASELVVAGVRSGQDFSLRYRIER